MAKAERIAYWMRSYLSTAGARGFVVGLSGGLDSAVVCRLSQMAAPGCVLGVLLPCHSDAKDEQDALAVASQFGVPTTRIDLSPAFDALVQHAQAGMRRLPDPIRRAAPQTDPLRGRVPLANMKPRLRMTSLYFMANSLDYLVVGAANRSELALGYFTKYGDGGADLLPIAHLLKREVRELAAELGVPQGVIDRPPSAGLWAGQTDEEEMGFTYAELERYLDEGPEAVPPALAMRIERLTRTNDHKRSMPPSMEQENLNI
jgi:NAD+ synthase